MSCKDGCECKHCGAEFHVGETEAALRVGAGKKADIVQVNKKTFLQALAEAVNRHSRENESNTPDFVLACFLDDCLNAFDDAMRARDEWYCREFGDTGDMVAMPNIEFHERNGCRACCFCDGQEGDGKLYCLARGGRVITDDASLEVIKPPEWCRLRKAPAVVTMILESAGDNQGVRKEPT